MFITTSIAIFSLLFTFAVGIYASREIKNLYDYGLSKGTFSSWALMCTIVASFVGGGVIIGTAEKTFSLGIAPLIGLLGFPCQIILTGLLIAPRMDRFSHVLSIGDVLGEAYGQGAKLIAGVCWFLFCIGIVVAQMTALGRMLDVLLDLRSAWNLILGSGIVVLYCFLGGIRAVVTTDIIQFLILTASLPLALFLGIQHQGGWTALFAQLPPSHLALKAHYSLLEILMIFLSFLLGDALIPPVMQRILMSRDGRQAKHSMVLGGIVALPLCCIGAGMGFVAYSCDSTLASSQAVPFLLNTVLPPVMRGFAISGILAVITSSADSYLNSASLSFVNDIVKPLYRKPLGPKGELYFAKFTTLAMGMVAMIFSMRAHNVFDILLETYKFWGPTLVIPLGALVLNKPVTKPGFYLSIGTGALLVFLWDAYELQKATQVTSLIVGILGNFSVYLLCRGWLKNPAPQTVNM